jgi:hypothetical protein
MYRSGYKIFRADHGHENAVTYSLTIVVMKLATSLRVTYFCLVLEQSCPLWNLTDMVEGRDE